VLSDSFLNPRCCGCVLFIVPADKVVPLLEECGEKGVKAAIVTSSGFAERVTGVEKSRGKIREITKKYGWLSLDRIATGWSM